MIGGEKFDAARKAVAAPNLPAEQPANPDPVPRRRPAPAAEPEKRTLIIRSNGTAKIKGATIKGNS